MRFLQLDITRVIVRWVLSSHLIAQALIRGMRVRVVEHVERLMRLDGELEVDAVPFIQRR